ncbi:hypothetical protein K1719_017744 [Acacia pycnantha]|nr:hypothetical protein K1719_017744 [Acacia pycnantha]
MVDVSSSREDKEWEATNTEAGSDSPSDDDEENEHVDQMRSKLYKKTKQHQKASAIPESKSDFNQSKLEEYDMRDPSFEEGVTEVGAMFSKIVDEKLGLLKADLHSTLNKMESRLRAMALDLKDVRGFIYIYATEFKTFAASRATKHDMGCPSTKPTNESSKSKDKSPTIDDHDHEAGGDSSTEQEGDNEGDGDNNDEADDDSKTEEGGEEEGDGDSDDEAEDDDKGEEDSKTEEGGEEEGDGDSDDEAKDDDEGEEDRRTTEEGEDEGDGVSDDEAEDDKRSEEEGDQEGDGVSANEGEHDSKSQEEGKEEGDGDKDSDPKDDGNTGKQGQKEGGEEEVDGDHDSESEGGDESMTEEGEKEGDGNQDDDHEGRDDSSRNEEAAKGRDGDEVKGIPIVAVPQWTDQPTVSKFIKDVWKIGVKAEADEKGIVSRETVKKCIERVVKRQRGKEMKMNAFKLKSFAVKACDEGGTSDKNIDDFQQVMLQLLSNAN